MSSVQVAPRALGDIMKYRLHIDVPLVNDMKESVDLSQQIIQSIQKALTTSGIKDIEMNYRLGNDEDRQKANYLNINENGHASNKKNKIVL